MARYGRIGAVEAVRCEFGLEFGYSTIQKGSGKLLVDWDVVEVLPENPRILVRRCLEKAIMLVRVKKPALNLAI